MWTHRCDYYISDDQLQASLDHHGYQGWELAALLREPDGKLLAVYKKWRSIPPPD